MIRLSPALLAAGAMALLASPGAAQHVAPSGVTRLVAPTDLPTRARMSAPDRPESVQPPAWTQRPVVRRLTAVFGGSALGAGLGYMISQIQMSDWESQARSHSGQALRRRYSLGGALGGAALGAVIPVGRRGGTLPARRAEPTDAIWAEQIRVTGAANAYDAVQSLRPRWLAVREVLSIGQALGGAVRADHDATGDYGLLVYLDRTKLGNVDALRQIDLPIIHHITFYNGTEATYRWGWGHAHGVIHVSTTAEALPD